MDKINSLIEKEVNARKHACDNTQYTQHNTSI